jgi:NhaA family Na+:H+ antiporter
MTFQNSPTGLPTGHKPWSFNMDAFGGMLLVAAAALAIYAENSDWSPLYQAFLSTPFAIHLGEFGLEKPLILWINDGLMALFFLLVGLEIKREVAYGRLSTRAKAALPLAGALGGMVAPALVFIAFNFGSADNMQGWAIPMATDIAFALGILALLGTRAPTGLKIFLLALAVIDDLGAILIIAFFYTANLSLPALGLAAACVAVLIAMNRFGIKHLPFYFIIGAVLWVAVLKSGVHATIAGVVLALTIPIEGKTEESKSPLEWLEHQLHAWVNFLIMPIFAFANAGVSLSGLGWGELLAPLPLGIACGLFIGKLGGVMLASWCAVKVRFATLPEGVQWPHMIGVSFLTGIGFTMSLFIGMLAFNSPDQLTGVRLGVLCGSLASAIFGFGLLRFLPQRRSSEQEHETSKAA